MTDAELFRSAIEYFPDTGIFIWKVRRGHVAAGSVAGSIGFHGYREITYKQHIYKAHRIAWLLMTGDWPTMNIDHKNRDRSDNRWTNLRLATSSQNIANSIGRGKLPKGVRLHRWGKFEARIRKDYKLRYLGLFQTVEEAAAAYAIAAKQYFGEFARTELWDEARARRG